MAVLWSFRCYLSPDGTDEIRKAHDSEERQTRKKFHSRLKILAALPFEEWHNGVLYRELHGECFGLGEIKFKGDNVKQRPLGFRSSEYEFAILFWAHERGNKWVPLKACQRALERKAEVIANKDRTNALWLALE
jgi:hypothetical protein